MRSDKKKFTSAIEGLTVGHTVGHGEHTACPRHDAE